MSKIISRTVVVLAIVSLLGDIASEMLYPIIPIYLQSIGFSAASLGLLEGLATAMSGLSKGYFGQLSDIRGIRMPFIRIGYLLSAISKPMLALFTNTWWIFTARTADRLGQRHTHRRPRRCSVGRNYPRIQGQGIWFSPNL
jgi:hypothetical protein